MEVGSVRNAEELHEVLLLVHAIFPQLRNEEYRFSRDFWMERMSESPELLLYARDGATICGSVFGCVEQGAVTIGHCCVDGAYRGRGVGSDLMLELEKRARELGHRNIVLGAEEGAEGFYERLGYSGSLLIQSEEHSVDELKALNERYEVIGTNVYNGTVSQLWLRLPRIDREFQRSYERALPGCYTQMTFGKAL